MMLFGERDMLKLESFFSGSAHGSFVVRSGGFDEQEEIALASKFLGPNNSNLLRLIAVEGKKSVSVEQVRNLAASLSMTARGKGERRLVVVSDRFSFGAQAQNAFLKILEEPPEGVFFLLLGSGEDSFLPTISSRSQLIKLEGPSEEETIKYLHSEVGLKAEEAKMLYLQAGGSPSEILRLSKDETARRKSLELLSQAKGFLGKRGYDRLVILKNYQNPGKRDEALDFLKSLLVVLELVSKKDAKETLRWSGLVEKTESALVNLKLNANSKVELLNLV